MGEFLLVYISIALPLLIKTGTEKVRRAHTLQSTVAHPLWIVRPEWLYETFSHWSKQPEEPFLLEPPVASMISSNIISSGTRLHSQGKKDESLEAIVPSRAMTNSDLVDLSLEIDAELDEDEDDEEADGEDDKEDTLQPTTSKRPHEPSRRSPLGKRRSPSPTSDRSSSSNEKRTRRRTELSEDKSSAEADASSSSSGSQIHDSDFEDLWEAEED